MTTRSQSLTKPKGRLPRVRWYAWLLLIVVIGYAVAYLLHWDDRGVLWIKESQRSPSERAASVWLPDYKVDIDAKPMLGLEKDEASDLSYNPITKTLFSVMGKNAFLVELTLKGDVLRKIPLVGWSNPEGVAVLENGLIAITDERQHLMSIVKVAPDTTTLNITEAMKYDLGPSKDQNKGFEGIAWDPRRQQILLGEERPAAMFTWKSDGSGLFEGDKQKIANLSLPVRNLSSLSVERRTGHTLLLSADSHLLLELDDKGQQISFMALLGGLNGLNKTIPRAEGVAFDESGTMYMVSEPNLFYSFKKQ